MKKIYTLILGIVALNSMAQNYQWAKNIGSNDPSGYGILCYGIAVDNNGSAFIAGSFNQTVDFDPGSGTANLTSLGSSDIFFAKYDTDGNFLWAKSIGSSMSDIAFSITSDANGNIYVAGYYGDATDFDPGTATHSFGFNGSQDAFIAKYDNDGNYVWAISIGGIEVEQISKVVIDGNGDVIVAGYFQNIVDFDPGPGSAELTIIGGGPNGYNLFFAKYTSAGDYAWAKQIPAQSTQVTIATNQSGNVFVAGSFDSTVDFDPGSGTATHTATGNSDIFFARYDTNGNFIYSRTIGGPSTTGGLDKATDIEADDAGNIYLCGIFGLTADFDPGNGTANLTSLWSGDMFFARYDANGNYLWAKNLPADDYSALRIYIDRNSDIVLSGYYGGTTDFDPGSGIANLTVTGNTDLFFAKYDNSGNYLSAQGTGNIYGSDLISDIATDNNGNIYITGMFVDNADFDMGNGTATLTTAIAFGQDVFIAKYTEGPVGIQENNTLPLLVYPNPSAGIFNVVANAGLLLEFTLSDLAGRIIARGTLREYQTIIDLSLVNNGLYFLNIENRKYKLIKR